MNKKTPNTYHRGSHNWVIYPLIIALVLCSPLLKADDAIVLSTGEWSPYTTRIPMDNSQTTQHYAHGLVVDIVSATLDKMNIRYRYEFRQWGDLDKDIVEGKVKLVFPYAESDKRKDKYLFSTSLLKTQIALYFNVRQLKSIPSINQSTDLDKYSLIKLAGYEYLDKLENAFRAAKNQKRLVEKSSEIEAFESLLDSKQKLILPLEMRVGDSLLDRYFKSDKHKIDRVKVDFLPARDLYLMASKSNDNSQKFINDFNQAFGMLNEEGILKAIMSKYQQARDSIFEVYLKGTSSSPLVYGLIDDGKDMSKAINKDKNKNGILIPNGTRAKVIQWNQNFIKPGKFDIKKEIFERSKVELLEGPHRGEQVWVRNQFLSY